MRKLLIIAFCFSSLFAYQEIENAINEVSQKSGVSPIIYRSIAKVESDNNPLLISFITSKKSVETMKEQLPKDFKISAGKYNQHYLVSISASEEKLIQLSYLLWNKIDNIDFGLMQVSKQNMNVDEIKHIFRPKYNLIKANNILGDCVARFKNTQNAIQCYNTGFRQPKNYTYYYKFLTNLMAMQQKTNKDKKI